MKRLISIVFIFALFILSGCAQKKLSREEQLAIQERNSAAAVQIYEGYTVDELAKTAEKVLYLMDPSDMIIEHKKNKVIAHRKWLIYVVLNASMGNVTYVVNFDILKDDKIKVSLMARDNAAMLILPTPISPDAITLDSSILYEADCKLFFDRMDYFLGKSKIWRTCKEASKWVEEQNFYIDRNGNSLPGICEYVGIEDKEPDYLEKK